MMPKTIASNPGNKCRIGTQNINSVRIPRTRLTIANPETGLPYEASDIAYLPPESDETDNAYRQRFDREPFPLLFTGSPHRNERSYESYVPV